MAPCKVIKQLSQVHYRQIKCTAKVKSRVETGILNIVINFEVDSFISEELQCRLIGTPY